MSEIDYRACVDVEALVAAATSFLRGAVSEALSARGRASLMLSGGSSPKPIYEALAREDLAWDGVGIGLVDERWVPSGHAASNADFIRACFAGTPAEGAQFMPLYNGHATPKAGLDAAEQALALMSQPFDVCVLGMGGDSHTASWFPGSKGLSTALDPDNAATLCAVDAEGCPGAGEITDRMSLTFSAVASARRSVLLLPSREKTDIFRTAADATVQDAPVRALLALGRRLTVFALESEA